MNTSFQGKPLDNEKAPVDSREYGENQWLVIVTFCRTYDPVATSELTSLAELQKDFGERRIKILGLAVNTKTTIEKWVSATEELSDVRVEFPIVADSDAVIASTLGLVRHGQPPHPTGVLHASMVLIVNPNNRVELMQQYPEAVGRNFHEVLRAVDALDMTFLNNHVSCGGNWASGEDVFINNDVEPIRAKSLFPRGFVEIKPCSGLAPSPKLAILDAATFDEGPVPDDRPFTACYQRNLVFVCSSMGGWVVPRRRSGSRACEGRRSARGVAVFWGTWTEVDEPGGAVCVGSPGRAVGLLAILVAHAQSEDQALGVRSQLIGGPPRSSCMPLCERLSCH